jgi:Asp-tRNA(Asn)/Glu-tRNA(Gln) amidotransferase A subunit family amidase
MPDKVSVRDARRGIVPLDNTSDISGPLARSVEDVARMLEVLAGVDPEDDLTNVTRSFNSQPANYTKFLVKEGLQVRVCSRVCG